MFRPPWWIFVWIHFSGDVVSTPIVPLNEENETAMEDERFMTFLKRIGISSPIVGQVMNRSFHLCVLWINGQPAGKRNLMSTCYSLCLYFEAYYLHTELSFSICSIPVSWKLCKIPVLCLIPWKSCYRCYHYVTTAELLVAILSRGETYQWIRFLLY